MVFKAAVRTATRSASAVDIGDLALIAMIAMAARSSGSLAGIPFLAMPSLRALPGVAASFTFLYLSGRLMVRLLDFDTTHNKRVNAGGAAYSLRLMGRPAAMAASVPYCLAGALLEEVLFRHALYSAMKETLGQGAATILQAAAFSAVHALPAALLGHGWRIVAYALSFPFVSGLILQRLYWVTGSVASPAIVHWALNVSAAWRASHDPRQVYDDAR